MKNTIQRKSIFVWVWFLCLPFLLGIWTLFTYWSQVWIPNVFYIGVFITYTLLSIYIVVRQRGQGYRPYFAFLLIPIGMTLAVCYYFAWLMFHLPS